MKNAKGKMKKLVYKGGWRLSLSEAPAAMD